MVAGFIAPGAPDLGHVQAPGLTEDKAAACPSSSARVRKASCALPACSPRSAVAAGESGVRWASPHSAVKAARRFPQRKNSPAV